MTRSINIFPGMQIRTQTGRVRARLSLIAVDEIDQRIGLSARHILEYEGGKEVFVFDDSTGVLLGKHVDLPRLVTGEMAPKDGIDINRLIGGFLIGGPPQSSVFEISNGAVGGIANPRFLVGSIVKRVDDFVSYRAGKLTSFGGSVSLYNPSDQTDVVYYNVAEISFSDEGINPVSNGDAGALIVDENNNAVGIIVGGTRERCFVAPLFDFMAVHNLQVLGSRPSRKHFSSPNEVSIAMQMRSHLLEAKSGVDHLKRDQMAEPRVFGDLDDDDSSDIAV